MNDHADTRLTDYALGELPEAERLQLEAELKLDAAARGEVEETQRLAGLLRSDLPVAAEMSVVAGAAETSPSLTLRAALQARLSAPASAPTVKSSVIREKAWAVVAVGLGLSLAAGLVLMLDVSDKYEMARMTSVRDGQKGTAAAPTGTLADPIWMSHDLEYESTPSAPRPNAAASAPVTKSGTGPLVLSGAHSFTGATSVNAGTLVTDGTAPTRSKGVTTSAPVATTAPAPVAGPMVHSPTAAQHADAFGVTRGTQQSLSNFGGVGGGGLGATAQPLNSPIPRHSAFGYAAGSTDPHGRVDLQAQQANQPAISGKPVSNEMYPLLLAHQEQLAKYGPKHPKVVETELKIKAVTEHMESLSAATAEGVVNQTGNSNEMYPLLTAHQAALAKYGPKHPKVLEIELKIKAVNEHSESELKLPRLLVRNRSDITAVGAANGRWDVDNDGDGKADTYWVDLGRPAKPAEVQEFQQLVDQMTSTIRPETWREAKSVEELEGRLSENQGYFDFQARVDSIRHSDRAMNTEAYDSVPENPFYRTKDAPLSTFSIDVDTASYSNVLYGTAVKINLFI